MLIGKVAALRHSLVAVACSNLLGSSVRARTCSCCRPYASGGTLDEIAAAAIGRSLAVRVKCRGALPDVASAIIVKAT